MPHRRALLVAIAVSGLAGAASLLAIACSSDPVADGAACEDNGECNSGVCTGGACAGRVCSTISSANECDQGWICSTRGATPGLSCTKTCSEGIACPSGTHCSNGLCTSGKDIALAWVKKPGDAKCQLNTRCRYEVRAAGDGAGDIANWKWTFGDAGVEGADADIEYAYPFPGVYPVTVTPSLASGGNGPTLDAVETVCVSDPEAECNPDSNDCCTGTCTLTRRCR